MPKRYIPRKWSEKEYKEKAKLLRGIRHDPIDLRKKLTRNEKRRIRYNWEKNAFAFEQVSPPRKNKPPVYKRNKAVTFKAVKKPLRYKKALGKGHITNKGVLIKTPRLKVGKPKITLLKDGSIKITVRTRVQIYKAWNPLEIAANPQLAAEKALEDLRAENRNIPKGEPFEYSFLMNGFETRNVYDWSFDGEITSAKAVFEKANTPNIYGFVFYYFPSLDTSGMDPMK